MKVKHCCNCSCEVESKFPYLEKNAKIIWDSAVWIDIGLIFRHPFSKKKRIWKLKHWINSRHYKLYDHYKRKGVKFKEGDLAKELLFFYDK